MPKCDTSSASGTSKAFSIEASENAKHRVSDAHSIKTLIDALEVMHKSPALARIRKALSEHRDAHHKGFFYICPGSPCSQFEEYVRTYVEAAQNEIDAPEAVQKLEQAIENRAQLLAASKAKHADESSHPINWLESPFDPVRVWNEKYPGLDFHRGPHKNADPAISAKYYVRFCETGSEEVLFDFMDAHRLEFECSGWAVKALGRRLLGQEGSAWNEKYPGLDFHRGPHKNADPAISAKYYVRFCETGSEEVLFDFMDAHRLEFECSGWAVKALGRRLLGQEGRTPHQPGALFRKCWKYLKRQAGPPTVPQVPQLFVLAIADTENARFSRDHRTHFGQAAMWVTKKRRPSNSLAMFRKDYPNACKCTDDIDFKSLEEAGWRCQEWSRDGNTYKANVLQEYVGIVCGVSSKTLRNWRSRLKGTKRRVQRTKSARHR